jgi:CP family cyanate transporter-like MFS transporter
MAKRLCLLWLAGLSMRVIILAVPPVLPLIRSELSLSETGVGFLIGLPLVTWSLAAVPGALLIARLGATHTMIAGLLLAALAGAARGTAGNAAVLYVMTALMGLGVAVMQPAVPTLVRDWMPQRIGLGTAVASNGLTVAVMLGPALTIPVVLPLVGQSWRLDLVFWSAPVVATAILYHWLAPRERAAERKRTPRWWPDWTNPLIWLLGFTFGSNNAIYFATNAFLPDYLLSIGRGDLISFALSTLNGSQLIASLLLLGLAEHLHRRAWPFLVFGPMPLAGLVLILVASDIGIAAAAALVGFSLAVTFVVTFALAQLLSPEGEVHRISAGMFTVSYCFALIVPVICGALWDVTQQPWTAFVPLGICTLALTVLGFALSRQHRPADVLAPN